MALILSFKNMPSVICGTPAILLRHLSSTWKRTSTLKGLLLLSLNTPHLSQDTLALVLMVFSSTILQTKQTLATVPTKWSVGIWPLVWVLLLTGFLLILSLAIGEWVDTFESKWTTLSSKATTAMFHLQFSLLKYLQTD